MTTNPPRFSRQYYVLIPFVDCPGFWVIFFPPKISSPCPNAAAGRLCVVRRRPSGPSLRHCSPRRHSGSVICHHCRCPSQPTFPPAVCLPSETQLSMEGDEEFVFGVMS